MYQGLSKCSWARTHSLTRASSSVHTARPEVQNSVYISQSTNPFFNLTFEDWLFRHSPPEKPLLLLYRNTPCVVIGRNQNPWKEVNMQALKSRNIPLVRRKSGGGTVYHDLGNTNFSIHLARRAFDRRVTSQIVLRAIQSLNVANASLNDRNDLCVADDKVSGSAYKIVSARAYHHGTMLISTRLDTLGDVLRVNKPTMVTAGVASVRSPVCNLQQTNPRIENPVFMSAMVDEFRSEYAVDEEDDPTQYIDESMASLPYIQDGMAELRTWDWLYGQTPQFTYTIEQVFAWGHVKAELRAKHGVILSCTLHAPSAPPTIARVLEELASSAEGERYGDWPSPQLEHPTHNGAETVDVTQWLVEMLK
ncbi:Lipoyltransferase and lipoate-protein ligase [Favolaschia claudopus]|uniref:Putative lipoate-protein ligase A n=1 Tax=Favolaschia claudopus TaxID=2862362 RepID=A0AAW0EDD8_9AGAR